MIINKELYHTMVELIDNQKCLLIKQNETIETQKEIIYDLSEENKALHEALEEMVHKVMPNFSQHIDFPNSENKSNERGFNSANTTNEY